MANKSKLYYDLVPSAIFDKNARYVARTRPVKQAGLEEIIFRMAGKNASLSRQAIIACLDLFAEVVEEILSEGLSVSTGLFSMRINLKGLFEDPSDGFDPHRHALHLKVKAAPGLEKRVLHSLRPARRRRLEKAPDLIGVTDYMTGSKNDALSQGGLCEIRGRNLRIDYDRSDCGFFLVPATDKPGPKKEFRHAHVERATERTALIRLPDKLSPGKYHLEARKQYLDGIVTGRLGKILVVE